MSTAVRSGMSAPGIHTAVAITPLRRAAVSITRSTTYGRSAGILAASAGPEHAAALGDPPQHRLLREAAALDRQHRVGLDAAHAHGLDRGVHRHLDALEHHQDRPAEPADDLEVGARLVVERVRDVAAVDDHAPPGQLVAVVGPQPAHARTPRRPAVMPGPPPTSADRTCSTGLERPHSMIGPTPCEASATSFSAFCTMVADPTANVLTARTPARRRSGRGRGSPAAPRSRAGS